MSKPLDLALQEIAGRRSPVWVDAWEYGRQRLLKGGPAPWQDVGALVAHHRKLQALVDSDVVSVDVGDFYDRWLDDRSSLSAAMAEKQRLGYALRTQLADPGARAALLEVVNALCDTYPGQPVVLSLPAPRSWMAVAHCRARQLQQVDVSWDNAESAAMYLADFLRIFAQCGLSGVLLRDRITPGPAGPEDLERYRPVFNLAEHYQWQVVLDGIAEEYDPERQRPVVATIRHRPVPGEGLAAPGQAWEDRATIRDHGQAFWYAEIPAHAAPDRVLEVLALLRSSRAG